MTAVIREIMTLYKLDGIFSNRWDGSGMCYCIHCQTNFRKFSGLDLPRTEDPLNEARRQYTVWRQHRLVELRGVSHAEIKNSNPNAAFIANAGGGAPSDLDRKTIGELAPAFFADRQARLPQGRRSALPLEGLRSKPQRNSPPGGRRRRP